MTRIRALTLLTVALPTATIATALVVAATTGHEESVSEVRSGVLEGSYELSITPSGGEQTESGRIGFSGPFEGEGGDELPNFDLAVTMQQTGERDVEFGMIATDDAGYIEFEGQGYELEQAVFERLKSATPFATLDTTRWFIGLSGKGREEIDGTETIHTSGTANVERILPDLEQAAKQIGLKPGNLEAPSGCSTRRSSTAT